MSKCPLQEALTDLEKAFKNFLTICGFDEFKRQLKYTAYLGEMMYKA
ncbi:hypothetical protein [Dapis sp. BLCC M172]